MTILKKSNGRQRKEVSILGIYIPKKEASYLSLYSFSTGITKTSIFENDIKEWLEKTKKEKSIKDLIRETALKAFDVWNNPKGKRTNFNTFRTEFKIELINRGLKEYADEILNILNDEKNKKN